MANLIMGTAAAELLAGSDENDIIYTNGGADTVWGFGGNDTLVQNVGTANTLLGGLGNDVYVVLAGTINISESFGGGVDKLRTFVSMTADLPDGIENIENINYGGALTLIGNSLNNRIVCGFASDTVHGRGGSDTILGSAFNPCTFFGEGGNDHMVGGVGGNNLTAGDVMDGGSGNDLFEGRSGPDNLTGGTGKDIFRYLSIADSRAGAGADVIADFDDFGDDRIDLSAVFGPHLVYRHAGAFTGVGQVRIIDIPGPDVIVAVNTHGSLAADMHILLTGTTLASMTASDFIL